MVLPSKFLEKYGPYAVITGASSGIGEEYARQLAAAGFNLVITARRSDRLEKLSQDLKYKHRDIDVRIIIADLTKSEDVEKVTNETENIDVGLLVNNAGMEQMGNFFAHKLERHCALVDVNVKAPLMLSYGIGQRLIKRKKGGIIFVSSMLSQPAPYYAVYSASKAFVTNMSVMLGYEFRKQGVDVLCMESGAVVTEMYERVKEVAGDLINDFPTMTVKDAVADTLPKLGKLDVHTPGVANRIMLKITNFLPRGLALRWMGSRFEQLMNPKYLKPA